MTYAQSVTADEMTTAEVAEMLGVSSRRAQQLAAELGARQEGGRKLLFPRAAVEALAESESRRARGLSTTDLLAEILVELREIRALLNNEKSPPSG